MKIAIVGLGGSFSDYISARIRSETYDETWGINCIGGVIEVDKTIMMDPVSGFLITRQSECLPPEPMDVDPVLIGRHDLHKLNGKAQNV